MVKKGLNPIAILDLIAAVLSILVFHLTYEIQCSFRGLIKPAFVIFYSVALLSLIIVILEITGFIVQEISASNIALHTFMFAVLLLILLGMFKLRAEISFKDFAA